ncbi:glycosyl transferase [Acinetobacter baumannii]|uniref:glycosyltransferase family 4 protein n=1 Tax=Acinetobacter baumannii TaxID=470 RepID=UPI000DE730BB|nr:glycosyltransferase family 4 protein [Acinetobacter baumannii]SSP00520.1 glycosyl transferase [Acinetobacter baumannii]
MKFILIYSKIFNLKDDKDILSQIGGVQRYMYELAKLLKNNFNNEVILIQFGNEELYLQYEGLKIYQYNYKNTKELIENLRAYKFISMEDIIIWGSDTLSIKTEFKSISIQHGIACDYFSRESKLQKFCYKIPLLALGYKFLQLLKSYKVFENTQYRVCVDYNYLNWYRTLNIYRNNMDNIHVIPNFTKIPEFKKRIENEKIIISFARRFHHKRGAKLLCEVADNLLTNFSSLEFWFAGEGEELNYVENLKQKYPMNVKITKFSQNSTFDYHQKVDIAVIPTIASEGTSLSLLEAMASNCAVVCTNIGGMTNIILDEFNGLLVNPEYEDLKQALTKLINSYELRNKLSNNAYHTVRDSFSLKIWEKKWLALIHKVIENHD